MKNPIVSIFKNQTTRNIIISSLLILIVLAVYYVYQIKQGRLAIENSVIQAPLISISPTASGKLSRLTAYEGQLVKKGDLLATVGSEDIHADTEGLVVMANNTVVGVVSNQTPLIQLINPTSLRVAGTLDENKGLNRIKPGQVVSFTVDALPGKTFWGFVDEVSPAAKQTQLAFSISNERPTQQFVIYARFDSKTYPEIKNGMSAKMTVYTRTPEN